MVFRSPSGAFIPVQGGRTWVELFNPAEPSGFFSLTYLWPLSTTAALSLTDHAPITGHQAQWRNPIQSLAKVWVILPFCYVRTTNFRAFLYSVLMWAINTKWCMKVKWKKDVKSTNEHLRYVAFTYPITLILLKYRATSHLQKSINVNRFTSMWMFIKVLWNNISSFSVNS